MQKRKILALALIFALNAALVATFQAAAQWKITDTYGNVYINDSGILIGADVVSVEKITTEITAEITADFEWTDEVLTLAMFEGGALDNGYKREQLRGAVLVATATRNRLEHATLFGNTVAEELASGEYFPLKTLDDVREQMFSLDWTDAKIASYIARLRNELEGGGKFDWSEEMSLDVYYYKRDDVQTTSKWWKSLPKLATCLGQSYYGLPANY